MLKDVTFRVQPAGRDRAIRERRRNVHAFAVGIMVDYQFPGDAVRVTYSPFREGRFVTGDGETVTSAKTAYFTGRDLYVNLLD